MRNLKLERPLAIFDLETTGTRPDQDRIVEVSVLVLRPSGAEELYTQRVNPGVPIPAGAAAVHGIRDEDVAQEPPFREIAPRLLELLEGADLAGFNVIGYDLPLLEAEFARARVPFRRDGRRLVDAQRIFHMREPRTLSAALRFYTGREHAGAHGAEADVRATAAVLDAQIERYDDLPRDVEGLARACVPDDWVDAQGKIRWVDGEAAFEVGKHRGKTLRTVVGEDPSYLRWMADRSDFPPDTRAIVADALQGRFPRRRDPDEPDAPGGPDDAASGDTPRLF